MNKIGRVFIFMGLICSSASFAIDNNYEKLSVELDLTAFDLQDLSDAIYHATKEALMRHYFKAKTYAENEYANFVREQSKNLQKFADYPEEFARKVVLLTKAGDFLLPEENWNSLSSYVNANFELLRTVAVSTNNNSEIITKYDYLKKLSNLRKLDLLELLWKSWQEVLFTKREQFSNILSFVEAASQANDQVSIEAYWEMLTEYEDGYEAAKVFWKEIEPLYEKLHTYVKSRLNTYHNIVEDDTTELPVYLLGSNFGDDWSHIFDIVLTEPRAINTLNQKLKTMNVEDMYEAAERVTAKMGLGTLEDQFWLNSIFNDTFCDDYILSNFDSKHSEIITCSDVSLSRYIRTHENAVKISLNNQNYTTLLFENFRHSPVNEALSRIGGLFAVDNLLRSELKGSSEHDKIMVLLYTALRVLPKLSYYLAVDTWRLNYFNDENPVDIAEGWENTRRELRGVRGMKEAEFDFLEDPNIVMNKPYLSEFLGTLLQFQIYDYYRRDYEAEEVILDNFLEDPTFIDFIKSRNILENNWRTQVSFYFNIEDISAGSLLNYFKPLEEYLENVPAVGTITPQLNNAERTTGNISLDEMRRETEIKSNYVRDKNLRRKRSNVVMYVAIAFFACVIGGMVAVQTLKKLQRKRRTNNRRFET